jgi:A/G-specific adenine glycosylase
VQRIKDFQEQVWDYYKEHGRGSLPWRQPEVDGGLDSYKIMVSEIMLQQTQVNRVIPKYQDFLATFPNIQILAQASFSDVLKVWSGLGYNRRAKFMLDAAKIISKDYKGLLPQSRDELIKLPGIGLNTAAAILVYAFNQSQVFIETNIRTVFIHHFFADEDRVSDKELLPYIQKSLDAEHPREWYWALMDYGSYLKSVMPNPSRRSKHHTRQSVFEGSLRQLRARILRLLLEGKKTEEEIGTEMKDERTGDALKSLAKDGLISFKNKHYYLA